MKHIKVWLAAITCLICIPAFADSPASDSVKNDPFNEVVATYLAANPKPQLPEEARKFKVQAEYAIQEKQFDSAVELYGKALEIVPWWPQGHFNRALILGELKKYREAMREMKRYVRLAPDAPDARAAQDKVYQWESADENEKAKFSPPMVVISGKNYEMGKYEVTQAEWQAVMGNNPSHFKGANLPVEDVSWNEIQEYLTKLNQMTGKQYRLPTEAEWQYACYGGNQTEYCGSNDADEVAWHGGFGTNETHPVGQKKANGYGLYDMSGNVWEYVEDCWEGDCAKRVVRGGSWGGVGFNATGRHASYKTPDRFVGFRVAHTLP